MSALSITILVIALVIWGLVGFLKTNADSKNNKNYDNQFIVAWAIFIGGPFIWLVCLAVVIEHVWVRCKHLGGGDQ